MTEQFVLSRVVDGKESRKAVFSRAELKALMQGLYYAKVKESNGKRKAVYGGLYSKLWQVLKGRT